jgi:hypothetical protein
VKKVSYVASMLLVALSTAGAMVIGQSFAAQNDKTPCVDTSKSQAKSDPKSDESQKFPQFMQEHWD